MTAAPTGTAAALFRGLADPARLAIVQHLALGEHRVVDLTAHLGLAQSTVSGHLACLRDCGLVVVHTPTATLVMPAAEAQRVKELHARVAEVAPDLA